MRRPDGRRPDETRPIEITTGFLKHPHGAVLFCAGDTKVVCTAMVEDRVPVFLKDTGQGWITSEYAMLPGATDTRGQRESSRGRPSGRSQEIQRLIGRSLRAAVDRKAIGERTIWLDCDVIQADGGTRTASITGAFIALVLALNTLKEGNKLRNPPIVSQIAAISVGVVAGTPLLDLCYEEDSSAGSDLNVVMDSDDRFIEVQGTAEGATFSRQELDGLLDLAAGGIKTLTERQNEALGQTLEDLRVPHLS